MAADASIYSLIRPPQALPNPVEQYGQGLQLKNLVRADKEAEATQAAWNASGGDLKKFGEILSSGGGSYKPVLEVQKAGLDIAGRQASLDKTNLETNALKIKTIREIAAQVTSDADLPAARERVAQIVGPDAVNKIPFFNQPYDPENQRKVIMSVDAKHADMKPDWKNVDTGGQVVPRQMNPGAPGFSASPLQKTPAPPSLDKRPFQITDAAGNTKLVDVQGNVIKDLGPVGKPSATYEKTVAARKKLETDMSLAISELEKATADGGLIDQSTGSGIGAAADWSAALIGKATPGSIAVGAMKPIADLALKMVPRFEGPQSDKDTQSYRDAAGDLANPNLPNERKKMAGREILRLMKKRKGQFTSTDIEGTEADNQLMTPAPTNNNVPPPPPGFVVNQ